MTDVQEQKGFLEVFPRYHPADHLIAILKTATDIGRRVDKERRYVEISAQFPFVVEKSIIYEIEEGIRQAYTLNRVMLLPKYPAELFREDYIPQILEETERVGVVARGFFTQYAYHLTDGALDIEIPIPYGGIALMEDAKTPSVIEAIIRSEFGLSVKVTIRHVESAAGDAISERRLLQKIPSRACRAPPRFSSKRTARCIPRARFAVSVTTALISVNRPISGAMLLPLRLPRFARSISR